MLTKFGAGNFYSILQFIKQVTEAYVAFFFFFVVYISALRMVALYLCSFPTSPLIKEPGNVTLPYLCYKLSAKPVDLYATFEFYADNRVNSCHMKEIKVLQM
jgi:hypothetical protein